ncbi:zinc-binding dehydrogenase, partial [Aquabacterium sp.]|uniref:zinc-binding dehydrogenase n=1 Tax=Aquabacterium sp. TaxID=1872578 RepID=UPI002CD51454
PGGYADLVRVPHARYLVPIGTLAPERAATFACAGITAFGAIRKLDALGADDHVVVVGCGGVGMTAVALLSATSAAKVVAIDPDPAKRDAALHHGAALAFDPDDPQALKTISSACQRNIAAALDFVGSQSSSSLAIGLVRRGGQVIVVGLFGGELRLPLPSLPLRVLRLAGSYVGSLNELRELVALAQTITLPTIPLDLRPLASVNQALDDLAKGRVVGRVVLQP